MSTEQRECRGALLRETEAAICVTKDANAVGPMHWFPRSQIGYLRKDKRDDGGTNVVFTINEWLIEAKNAWDLVP